MVGLSLAGGQTTFRETVRRTLGEEGMSTGTNAGISKACQGAWIPSTRYQPGDRDPPPWPGTPGEELIRQKRGNQASHSTALEALFLLLQTALHLFSPPWSWASFWGLWVEF